MYDNKPKYGNPRSEAERRRRHARLNRGRKAPVRGTGKLGNVAEAMQRGMKRG